MPAAETSSKAWGGRKRPLWELDLAEVGKRLVMLAVTSRQLGHSTVGMTARDYAWPHQGGSWESMSDEDRFVVGLMCRPVDEVVTEEEMLIMVQAARLPSLG